MKKFLLILLAISLLGIAYVAFSDYDHHNDTLYYSGDILTMTDSLAHPEALYVKDGKIVAVGTKEELLKQINASTQQVDLQGKTLMPGFFDAHGHFDMAALFYAMTDVSGVIYRTPQQVWQRIEAAVKKAKAGEWVFIYGLDPILTKGIQTPTLAYMDSIAPDKPLFIITKALHVCYANSKAFAQLGITAKTPDPSKASYYEKDAQGKLTGAIVEQEALAPFAKKAQEKIIANYVPNTVGILQDYAKLGVTSIVNMGLGVSNKSILSLYEHLAAGQSKPLYNLLQMVGKLPKRQPAPRIFVYFKMQNADLLPENPNKQDDFYRIIGVKFWYDGSPYSGSMFLKQPYIRSDFTLNSIHLPSNHTSTSLMSEDELKKWIEKIQAKGYPVAVHAQGDIANEETISAFKRVNDQQATRPFRHRIEHCMLLPKNQLDELKRLNLTPSFHINHLLYYGEFLDKEIIGAERAANMFPIQSVVERQIPYSLHADMPQFVANPLRLASTSVNRTTEAGLLINASERVSVWQALKSITIDAAWQLHMDDKLGTLQQGKYADMVILDKNPLKIAPQDLASVQVLQTLVAGHTVWRKP